MEKQLIPQLRFPEFEGLWKKKKLKEVAIFLDNQRKPIKSAERAKMKGDYPYYGASGIIDYVNQYIFDDELILLGEDGENIISRNLPLAFKINGKCWVNNHAHVLKPNNGTNIGFLTENLELVNYVVYNTGTAQPKLNKEVCKNIPLNFPSLPEQQKISSFLSDVDDKITKLIKKKDLLEEYKKGILQKIFNQELRFKDDDGNDYPNWRKGRIDKFGYFYYGKSAPKFSLSDDAPTPCVRYGELYSTYDEVINEIKSYTNIEPDNLKFSKGGEVLVPRVGEDPLDFANCSYLPLSNIAIGEMISVYNTNENGLFITYFFNAKLREKFARVVEGANVSNLYFKYLEDIEIEVPCLEEQDKIVDFLSDITSKIDASRTKIEKAKSFKKGLLQQMFV